MGFGMRWIPVVVVSDPMKFSIPPRLTAYIKMHDLDADIVSTGLPMPTVSLAAAAIRVPEMQILKSLVFTTKHGDLVLAIAAGPARIDRDRLAAAAGLTTLRLATPDEVLAATGYPAGGVAPIAHATTIPVVIDQVAASLDVAYGGAGTEDSLIRIAPADIVRLTGATVADITLS